MKFKVGDLLDFIQNNEIPVDAEFDVQDYLEMEFYEDIDFAYSEGALTIVFNIDEHDFEDGE